MRNKKGLVFAGIGFELLGLIVAAVILGLHLDEKMNTQGIITAILIFLALAIWIFHLIVMMKKFEND